MCLCTVLLAMLSFATLALGQTDIDHTGGFRNGRVWVRLATSDKVYYVGGIKDGQVIATFALPADTPRKYIDILNSTDPTGFVVGDYAKALDDFYKEPANVRIPIIYAYHFISKKLSGMSPTDLADFEANLRKTVLNMK